MVSIIWRVCSPVRMRESQYAPHAPRVRSGVAILHRLVVLRRFQRHDVPPVAQRDKANLFASQILLDHQAAACGSHKLAGQQPLRRLIRLFRDPAMMTPLPAAKPSAFKTTG
jgi:hypothetical protein